MDRKPAQKSSKKQLGKKSMKKTRGGASAPGGAGFFRSVGGIKTETEVVEIQPDPTKKLRLT